MHCWYVCLVFLFCIYSCFVIKLHYNFFSSIVSLNHFHIYTAEIDSLDQSRSLLLYRIVAYSFNLLIVGFNVKVFWILYRMPGNLVLNCTFCLLCRHCSLVALEKSLWSCNELGCERLSILFLFSNNHCLYLVWCGWYRSLGILLV